MQSTNSRFELVRSLKPIFIIMRFIGIELDSSTLRSRPRYIAITVCGGSFIISTALVSYMEIQRKWNHKNKNQNSNYARGLTLKLSVINLAVFSVLPHFVFMITAHTCWKKLFDTLQRIEIYFKINDLYKKCRRMTRIGLVFLTVVTCS